MELVSVNGALVKNNIDIGVREGRVREEERRPRGGGTAPTPPPQQDHLNRNTASADTVALCGDDTPSVVMIERDDFETWQET
eukprot:gene1000-6766_t